MVELGSSDAATLLPSPAALAASDALNAQAQTVLQRIRSSLTQEALTATELVEPTQRSTTWLINPKIATDIPPAEVAASAPGQRRRRIARRPPGVEASARGVDGLLAELDRQLAELKLSEIQNHQLDRELDVIKRELARVQSSKRSTDLDLLEARRATRELEQRLLKAHKTISWQLGSALVESVQSISGIARLPKRLLGVYNSSRSLKRRARDARKLLPEDLIHSAEAGQLVSTSLAMLATAGGEGAAAWARAQEAKPVILANALIEIAKAVASEQPLLAAKLGSEAVELGPIEGRIKLLAFQLADLGHLRAAATLVDKAQLAGAKFNLSESKKAEGIRAMLRMLQSPPAIVNRRVTPSRQHERRVALVGREAPPLHATSSAFRLYDRALSAIGSGWKATVIMPPSSGRAFQGEPADERSTDGFVDLVRLKPVEHPDDVVDMYVSASAAAIAAAAVEHGCSVIRSDGFYTTGVAAALAARSIGCPLVVDIDELLDPKEPFYEGFERTEKGQMQLWMTLMTARAADVCVVANQRIKSLLVDVGVKSDQVVVSPHRVLRPTYSPEQLDALRDTLGLGQGPVIGVVRDLCPNYDSVVLGDILARLVPEFPGLKLLVVGAGRAGDGLRRRVAEHRLGHALTIVETPRFEDTAHYRALMDVTIFTRHNTTKSALIQPYEVVAAMGQGRPSVAYETVDTSELMQHGRSALLSPPGDVGAITDNVRTLIEDTELRQRIGQWARAAYEDIAVKEAGTFGGSDFYQRLLAAA